ncbi:MAG TPA: UDP-N-acetylglucosamine--N-acetylmuramyl-(pentapeptide) pyrophosphoryl-undecaprenol N-acetylglucosamine transferase [Gemmatimonadaceae bacterium]|nr:UDP-N-acetylglucosamine--N-acetylmuramyl-(pentapeptide) pyrophosphoryl-undecaprenol N-acetylglucosamine transferase [Gemmatimonadaceae bacterium]
MRVLFAGGGTGGHLYPGLAIARALQKLEPSIQPHFVGALRGIERNVLPTTEFPHQLLDLHPLYRSRPWENWKTIRGAVSAWRGMSRLAHEDRPRCVVGTGGYASGIALGYAMVNGIPIVVQEQNSYPGLTTRFFSRYARQVHNGFPEAATRLSPGSRTTLFDSGNPIEAPPDPLPDKRTAQSLWGFTAMRRVMLVYGGSQGSRAVNDVVAAWIARGVPEGLGVIWATGQGTYDDYASLESPGVRIRPYLSPVSEAYAATDFAISRGGAIATAELCAWGIPPVVIPLPTAAADHQTANARALAQAGAAEFIPQSALTVERLSESVTALLSDDALLAQRAASARARARPHAARDIAQRILELIRSSQQVD